MDMEEESYFLLQILETLHEKYERTLQDDLQQVLDEFSENDVPTHYTEDVDEVIHILFDENESRALFFEPYHDDFKKDLKSLRDVFYWKHFFRTFLHYIDIAIIHVFDDEKMTILHLDFVDVLEHHKAKDTQISSWKEMDRMVTALAEQYKETEGEQAAESPENSEPIREFLLRTVDYIYMLHFLYLSPRLQTLLDEFPGNRYLNEAVRKAIMILLNDPQLRARVDEAEHPLSVRDFLDGCVCNSKAAAVRDLLLNETISSEFAYESTLDEFIESRTVMPLNLLMGKIQIAAADIIAMDD